MSALRRQARRARGHVVIAMNPEVLAVVALAGAVSAVLARNAPTLIEYRADDFGTVSVAGALRIALLQSSTMAGLCVTAVVAASYGRTVGGDTSEQLASLLDPRPSSRLTSRALAVFALTAAATALIAVCVLSIGSFQALRAGGVRLTWGDAEMVTPLLARVALVHVCFTSVAIAVALLLDEAAAVAAATVAGLAQASLLLQHVMGSTGDAVLPTGWIAQLLQLRGDEFSTSYYWTTGASGGSVIPWAACIVGSTAALLAASMAVLQRRATA